MASDQVALDTAFVRIQSLIIGANQASHGRLPEAIRMFISQIQGVIAEAPSVIEACKRNGLNLEDKMEELNREADACASASSTSGAEPEPFVTDVIGNVQETPKKKTAAKSGSHPSGEKLKIPRAVKKIVQKKNPPAEVEKPAKVGTDDSVTIIDDKVEQTPACEKGGKAAGDHAVGFQKLFQKESACEKGSEGEQDGQGAFSGLGQNGQAGETELDAEGSDEETDQEMPTLAEKGESDDDCEIGQAEDEVDDEDEDDDDDEDESTAHLEQLRSLT